MKGIWSFEQQMMNKHVKIIFLTNILIIGINFQINKLFNFYVISKLSIKLKNNFLQKSCFS